MKVFSLQTNIGLFFNTYYQPLQIFLPLCGIIFCCNFKLKMAEKAEETSENKLGERKSVKSYATKVFKESSVSPVSAIVSTSSIPRKIFLALIFLLFATGFLYQCIKFLAYVLTYPTIVTVEIVRPEFYNAPAYTFCNYNKIRRTKFCAKYPHRCMVPDTDFCDKYPVYCYENETKVVPREEYYEDQYTSNEADVRELGHALEDLLINPEDLEESPEGPFMRLREDDSNGGITGCYSLHSRVDSPLPPLQTESEFWDDENEILVFNSEESEIFNPNTQPGVLLSIHSPFDAINPFEEGIYMKQGYLYKITVKMFQEKMLPYPFKTDCLNYTDTWLKNNKSGPRSQTMCTQLCLANWFLGCYKCVSGEIEYPIKERYCTKEELKKIPCEDDLQTNLTAFQCMSNCKDECLKIKYEYQVQERRITPKWRNGSITKESYYTVVNIEVESSEIISLEYKPQYQEVEAFSYIGGFIGIWLGVSLVQVVDVLESTFRIARYFFRKGTASCSRGCCAT